MPQPRSRHAGLTLIELLVSLPVAAVLLALLAQFAQGSLQARSVTAERHDTVQQARFALERIVAAVRATPSRTLATKAANTSGDWLSPVAFCLNAAAQLIETTPADTACTASRIIAERVTAFSMQTFNAGSGARTVIETSLTVSSSTGASLPMLARTRLGGGLL